MTRIVVQLEVVQHPRHHFSQKAMAPPASATGPGRAQAPAVLSYALLNAAACGGGCEDQNVEQTVEQLITDKLFHVLFHILYKFNRSVLCPAKDRSIEKLFASTEELSQTAKLDICVLKAN